MKNSRTLWPKGLNCPDYCSLSPNVWNFQFLFIFSKGWRNDKGRLLSLGRVVLSILFRGERPVRPEHAGIQDKG